MYQYWTQQLIMFKNPSAKIIIKDLTLFCRIGVSEEERERKQKIKIQIILTVDAARAIRSDSIADTVNYREVYTALIALVSNSEYHLLETLAHAMLRCCMEYKGVLAVTVRVEKPTVLAKTNGVCVELHAQHE